jgi:hypothetical protein
VVAGEQEGMRGSSNINVHQWPIQSPIWDYFGSDGPPNWPHIPSCSPATTSASQCHQMMTTPHSEHTRYIHLLYPFFKNAYFFAVTTPEEGLFPPHCVTPSLARTQDGGAVLATTTSLNAHHPSLTRT